MLRTGKNHVIIPFCLTRPQTQEHRLHWTDLAEQSALRRLLLQLLLFLLPRWLTIKPHNHKQHEPANDSPQPRDPRPRRAYSVTPWPLVVRKVPDRNLPSFLDICEEWSLVVHFERKDTVLIWCFESRAEDRAVLCLRGGV